MKRVLFIFLTLLLVFFACRPKHKKSINVVTRVDIDSTGEWIISKHIDNHRDSIILFWPNGQVKEKGILFNHYKKGWWNYYDSLGNLYVRSYEVFSKKGNFFEQQIFYFKDGQIDSTKSMFLNINIKDTLIVGKKNKAKVQLVSKYRDKKSRIVCLKMLSRQNFAYDFKDSICTLDKKSKLTFVIIPKKVGRDTLKGYIIEQFLDTIIYHEGDMATLSFPIHKYSVIKPVIVIDSLY